MPHAEPLLIRVDADRRTGTGHVMRCLALAHAWRDSGGEACFAMASVPEALEGRVADEGMDVVRLGTPSAESDDAAATLAVLRRLDCSRLVVDGYRFGDTYQEAVRGSDVRLLFVDDYGHAERYTADLVLNQNLYATEELYRNRAPYTRLLLGARYALLRREFAAWSSRSPEQGRDGRRVLVTMGGSDPDNVTLAVLHALESVAEPRLEVTVVAGPANAHVQSLRDAAARSPHEVRLLVGVSDMPELMSEADLAVTAAGSTCWELAFMGVPSITVILAENQEPIARSLEDAGVARNAGWGRELEPRALGVAVAALVGDLAARTTMAERARSLVDGLGASRVAAQLRSLS